MGASPRSNALLAAAKIKHNDEITPVKYGSLQHCPAHTRRTRGPEEKGTHRWSPGGARPSRGRRRRAREARAPTRGGGAAAPRGTAGGLAPLPPWPARPLSGESRTGTLCRRRRGCEGMRGWGEVGCRFPVRRLARCLLIWGWPWPAPRRRSGLRVVGREFPGRP